MKPTIHKFGGSILKDKKAIFDIAQKIKQLYLNRQNPVIVASALQGKTDRLLRQAGHYAQAPNPRELDMLLSSGEQEVITLLAIALNGMDVPAVSRNASQVKILTDTKHTEASLKHIDTKLILEDIRSKKVPIVAGFQGITSSGDWTTLGRGGSDLTAIALAHALKAKTCKIYTNVEGIFTTDPRFLKTATKHQQLHYNVMLEMATCGAHVMQTKAVEFAKKHETPFEVLSLSNKDQGTLVGEYPLPHETLFAIQLEEDNLQYSLHIQKAQQALIFKILEAFSDNGVALKSFSTDYHSGKTNLICQKKQEYASESLLLDILTKYNIRAEFLKENVSQMHLIHSAHWPAPKILKEIHQNLMKIGLQVKALISQPMCTSLTLKPSQIRQGLELLHNNFRLDTLNSLKSTPL